MKKPILVLVLDILAVVLVVGLFWAVGYVTLSQGLASSGFFTAPIIFLFVALLLFVYMVRSYVCTRLGYDFADNLIATHPQSSRILQLQKIINFTKRLTVYGLLLWMCALILGNTVIDIQEYELILLNTRYIWIAAFFIWVFSEMYLSSALKKK